MWGVGGDHVGGFLLQLTDVFPAGSDAVEFTSHRSDEKPIYSAIIADADTTRLNRCL